MRGTAAGGGSQPGEPAFDTSEYRANTYGTPDYYCDPTRALNNNGDGTLGDPWNLSQAKALPVAGDVVGILPSGDSAAILTTTNTDDTPAFTPTNSGSGDANANRLIYVTKYAAVALANVGTNANRTEFRHDGSEPTISGGGTGLGTGCPIIGSNNKDYITFDGFYIDQSHAWMKEDSGNLRAEACTGVKFLNFVIAGTAHTVASNCVAYRPHNAVDTVLSNFRISGFSNDGTGSSTPQPALFSDQYGDQNFTIEYFEIADCDNGIFPKGTVGGVFNYGTIRYGIAHGITFGIRANDFDADDLTEIHHLLIYDYAGAGIALSSETSDPRNVLIHHVTVANGVNNVDQHGGLYLKEAATMSNVTVRDNIFDIPATGHGIDAGELSGPVPTMNYNRYYRSGSTVTWAYDDVESDTIGEWRTATGQEANSNVFASDPFTNRASDDYTIAGGHAALTADSNGGEIGCYEGDAFLGSYGSYA